jgi:hypothetical protein
VREVAEQIIGLTGSGSAISFVPRPEDDPSARRPDISLATSALGWEPRIPREVGLAETLAWFSAQLGLGGPARPDGHRSAGAGTAPRNSPSPRPHPAR